MFKTFMDKMRQSDSKLLVGFIGVFTLSGLAYLAYKNYTRQIKSHIETPSEIDEANEEANEQSLGKKFPALLQKIIVNIKNNSKDQKTSIRAIYEGYHELALPQFKSITKKYRRERRKVMEDLQQYRRVLREYEQQIQTARMRCLITILTYFKFEIVEWFRLVDKYSSEYKQEWHQLTVMTDIMQLSALQDPPQKPIDSDRLVEVFQYKYLSFQQILNQVTNIFTPQDKEDLFIFIDRRLMDLIESKFGYEDEDVFLSMIAMGPVAKRRVEEIEEQIRTRLNSFTLSAK